MPKKLAYPLYFEIIFFKILNIKGKLSFIVKNNNTHFNIINYFSFLISNIYYQQSIIIGP